MPQCLPRPRIAWNTSDEMHMVDQLDPDCYFCESEDVPSLSGFVCAYLPGLTIITGSLIACKEKSLADRNFIMSDGSSSAWRAGIETGRHTPGNRQRRFFHLTIRKLLDAGNERLDHPQRRGTGWECSMDRVDGLPSCVLRASVTLPEVWEEAIHSLTLWTRNHCIRLRPPVRMLHPSNRADRSISLTTFRQRW